MSQLEVAEFNPPYLSPVYKMSVKRAPAKELIALPPEWFHRAPGPVYGRIPVQPGDNDLTRQHDGDPIGQRIVLAGRVLDSDGRPVPGALIEIWQTNAAGRYRDAADPGFMPLDPNFTGAGRCRTDSDGRYRFTTIKPAAYAGRIGHRFRPAHIHVSVFGSQLGSRLITQCYFEGDPIQDRDYVLQSVPDRRARDRLIARYDDTNLVPGGPEAALAYSWDIVLRGRDMTPWEQPS